MSSGAVVESIDPANGETFETYEVFDDAQIEAALTAAREAHAMAQRSDDRAALATASRDVRY